MPHADEIIAQQAFDAAGVPPQPFHLSVYGNEAGRHTVIVILADRRVTLERVGTTLERATVGPVPLTREPYAVCREGTRLQVLTAAEHRRAHGCRLAFADPQHAEVSGRFGSVPSSVKAAGTRHVLRPSDLGRPTVERCASGVLTPEQYIESLCPHTPLDEAEWPAPQSGEEAVALLRRMPKASQVICALTAAEMVLPAWEESVVDRPDVDVGVMRKLIATTWQWIRTRASREDVEAARNVAQAARYAVGTLNPPLYAALGAARAAHWAAGAALYATDAARYAVEAVFNAAIVAREVAGVPNSNFPAGAAVESHFMADWWRLCRCRLAFDDPQHAEVSGRTAGARDTYAAIRDTLRPRAEVFGLEPLDQLQRRCADLPDDPEWPAPKDGDQLESLLRRLPRKAALVCGITAVEMGSAGSGTSYEAEVIRQAWEVVRGTRVWVDVPDYGEGLLGEAAWNLAAATRDDPRRFRDLPGLVRSLTGAVFTAAYAATWTPPEVPSAFGAEHVKRFNAWLVEWWRQCRCRLAFDLSEYKVVSGQADANGKVSAKPVRSTETKARLRPVVAQVWAGYPFQGAAGAFITSVNTLEPKSRLAGARAEAVRLIRQQWTQHQRPAYVWLAEGATPFEAWWLVQHEGQAWIAFAPLDGVGGDSRTAPTRFVVRMAAAQLAVLLNPSAQSVGAQGRSASDYHRIRESLVPHTRRMPDWLPTTPGVGEQAPRNVDELAIVAQRIRPAMRSHAIEVAIRRVMRHLPAILRARGLSSGERAEITRDIETSLAGLRSGVLTGRHRPLNRWVIGHILLPRAWYLRRMAVEGGYLVPVDLGSLIFAATRAAEKTDWRTTWGAALRQAMILTAWRLGFINPRAPWPEQPMAPDEEIAAVMAAEVAEWWREIAMWIRPEKLVR